MTLRLVLTEPRGIDLYFRWLRDAFSSIYSTAFGVHFTRRRIIWTNLTIEGVVLFTKSVGWCSECRLDINAIGDRYDLRCPYYALEIHPVNPPTSTGTKTTVRALSKSLGPRNNLEPNYSHGSDATHHGKQVDY